MRKSQSATALFAALLAFIIVNAESPLFVIPEAWTVSKPQLRIHRNLATTIQNATTNATLTQRTTLIDGIVETILPSFDANTGVIDCLYSSLLYF
jgi:hypothetical protein